MQHKAHHSGPISATRAKRLAASSATAFALAALTGACGDHDPKVTLPSTTPPAGPTKGSPSSSPTPATPKDAASGAYTSFFSAVDNALISPPERIRPLLADFATGWYLDFEVRQIVEEQAQHLEPWGKAVVHITRAEVKKKTATVSDCQDASNAGLAHTKTHQLIPKTRGTAHRNLTAKLTLGGDGRWRLSELKQFKAACHT